METQAKKLIALCIDHEITDADDMSVCTWLCDEAGLTTSTDEQSRAAVERTLAIIGRCSDVDGLRALCG